MSATVVTTFPSVGATDNDTFPPRSVNLNAFESRLPRTSLIRSSSQQTLSGSTSAQFTVKAISRCDARTENELFKLLSKRLRSTSRTSIFPPLASNRLMSSNRLTSLVSESACLLIVRRTSFCCSVGCP